jgi:uncharacterized membrane protein HdeD (DUF308 family)
LHQGVWEVSIPKRDITEALDEGWVRSDINLPSPGVIASYRKGQYHVHEMEDEWKVHVDRYDPKEHPFLHLADDAPLVFMISGTFNAILFDSRTALEKGPDRMAKQMKVGWLTLMIFGIGMIFLGLMVSLNAWVVFKGLLDYIIPLAIIGFGVLTIVNGLRVRPFGKDSLKGAALGAGLVVIGAMFFFGGYVVLSLIVLIVLAIWAFVSAAISLRRAMGGKKGTPEGFYKRLGMGFFSLALGILIFFAPTFIAQVLILVLGLLAVVIGISLIINGYGLRKYVRTMGPAVREREKIQIQ